MSRLKEIILYIMMVLGGIGLATVYILAFIVLSQRVFGFDAQDTNAQQEEQKSEAEATYDAIKGRFANKDALERNLTAPLTSGTSFSTLDGRTQFNQQLSCPSSSNYLEIFFGIGPGGDITPVSVRQDSNFDGFYDWIVSFANPISGVCANGIISCGAGTFNDCTSFKWVTGSGTRLALQATDLAQLAGCYCVNNSCGNGLAFSNRNTVLDDLAGGMAGALMATDPRYAVSTVSREDFIIRLAGQDGRACAPEQGVAQHEHFDNPTGLSSDAFAASSGDPVFGLVSSIPTGDDVLLTTNGCRIERRVTLNEILSTDIINRVTASTDYGEGVCADDPDCFEFALGDDTDNHIVRTGCNIFTREIVWQVNHPDRLREAFLTDATYEDQIQISVNGKHIFATGGFDGVNDPHKCQIDDQRSVTINRSFRHALKEGTNRMLLKIAVRKRGSGQIRGRIRYTPECELIEESNSSCAVYGENEDCRLIAENVDGVQTWQNGGRTGLTPLVQTRTLHGAKCSETFTRPWFERARSYECETDADGALNFDFARQSHIYANSGVDQYSDVRAGADGALQTFTGNYNFDAEFGINDCEQICKVAVTETDNEVSSTGAVNALLTNPTTKNYNYHFCAGGVCPVGPGETLETDCGCLNEFTDAVAIMQTFRLAGRDLTCTSGTRQPLQ